MAKLFKLSPDNEEIVRDVFEKTGLSNYMDLNIFGIDKAREIVKVSKTSLIAEALGNCPDSIVCVVNEEVFDGFGKEDKEMVLDDAFSVVSFDDEKVKIKVGSPQVSFTLDGYHKYGEKLVNTIASGALYAIQIEERKKEEKRQKKNG